MIWLRNKQQIKARQLKCEKLPSGPEIPGCFQQEEVKPPTKEEKFSFKVTWTMGSTEQYMSVAPGVRRGIMIWQPNLKSRKSKTIT